MRQQLSLNLNLGAGCFVSCPGCYNHFGKSFVSALVILNFLEFMRSYGISKVTIGGGDPLTYPNILDLLEKIKEQGFTIQLDTVGTPLLDQTRSIFFKRVIVEQLDALRLAKLVDLIGIPLDGPSSAVIRQFRTGRENIFEEQMRILELLTAHGAQICINTVVHRLNIDSLYNLPSLLEQKIKIAKWQFFQFMPIGPLGYKNRQKYKISQDEFETFTRAFTKTAGQLSSKFEFKKAAERKGNYLFIDSDGFVWIPKISFNEEWDKNCDETDARHILGNINQQKDFLRIGEFLMHPCQNWK